MREHNGMRPQDIVVLLKIITSHGQTLQNKDLSAGLYISQSEVSESLNRSALAGLIDAGDKKKVHRQSLMEFIEHGLRYVFPAVPGTMVNGIYTAHSHPFMQKQFASEINYVWPDPRGEHRGLSILLLYKKQVEAVRNDEKLYLALSLIDVMRIGRVREMKAAVAALKKLIL